MNKKNTVRRGDTFEDHCYKIIKESFESLKFGALPSCCRFERKKKYYSKEIDDFIEFDLSVEIWLEGATEYSFVYLIECKDYDTKIPGSDITEFVTNVNLVAGLNVKAIVITTSGLQKRGLQLAKSRKIMWILVDGDNYNTMLYNSRKRKHSINDTDLPQFYDELQQLQEITSLMFAGENQNIDWDSLVEKFLRHSLSGNLLPDNNDETSIVGLERLSARLIKTMAENVLDDFDHNIRKHALSLCVESFTAYLQNKYKVTIEHVDIEQGNQREILGAYETKTNRILIDRSIVGTNRYKFVLAHEAAHFFLHAHLDIDQSIYDDYQDPIYNEETGRYELLKECNWLEWQANKFAACLLMPELSVMVRLILFQRNNWIRNEGRMFVDNDPVNQQLFTLTINALGDFFGVSETVIEYRLADVGILRYGKKFRRPKSSYNVMVTRTKTIGQLLPRVFDELEQMFLKRMPNPNV